MSDFYLKLVLGAVEEVLTQATRLESKPKIEDRKFSGHLITDKGGHIIESVSRTFNPNYDIMATGYERFGRLAPTVIRGGVGVATRYKITIEASAHNKNHPWDELFKLDNTLIVGSISLDTIETVSDRKESLLGGSATYAAVSSSKFVKPNLVGKILLILI